MAAKVAAVAVPAVLGIASIRIYKVKEKPSDGLLPRERLNIYTPLPQSAPARVVPERPGVIQSGITTARESIQPFVQASKDAYSSVKAGSVKLYHTLEDVYYYLKDPPPEFLPRFGTITMAGLLGMFLARKGPRFKRTVVPLGLMSAAASVCYPAQAVAVVKVTGKKVYGAGQWSSAALSPLFVSKRREAKDPTPPQPQAEEVPIVKSAGPQQASDVQSTEDETGESPSVHQTEAATPESAPVSNQPASSVISEEVSSVTLAEIPPSQTPADTGASSEEPSEPKQVSSPPVPDVYTPTLVPEPAQAGYTEAATADVSSLDSEPSVPVVVDDRPHEAPTEETAADHRDGAGFKADPALMDFGQSSPEDEDLYSTRS